jgi:energy-coupling factor transporter ATP-binding protein EcfA2
MLVEYIGLDNIKCFQARTAIDLAAGRSSPHKWVVVYGDNGLGKSTLLKTLGIALTGQPALNLLLPTAEGWVRGNNKAALIQVRAQKGPGDKSPGSARRRSISLDWGLIGASPLHRSAKIFPEHSISLAEHSREFSTEHGEAEHGKRALAKRHDDDVRLFNEHIATDKPKRGWMICGYGPHRRLSGASSDMAERIPTDGRAARLVTLFHEGAALTSAELWLRTLDHHARSSCFA